MESRDEWKSVCCGNNFFLCRGQRFYRRHGECRRILHCLRRWKIFVRSGKPLRCVADHEMCGWERLRSRLVKRGCHVHCVCRKHVLRNR